MAGPPTSAGSPSSTAPACSTATVASGLRRSAGGSSRDCTWSLASGSCCTDPGWGWAGHCGSTLPPSTSPTTSESTLAAPGDQAQLLQACQELARRRLDPARPLWELWLLPGLSEGRVGAFLRLHHVLADGAAAVAAFGALLDLTADAPTPVAPPWTPTPIPTASELLRDNLRRRRQELGRGWSGLAHPGRTLRRARRALPAWQEVLTEQPAPQTSLNHPVGADRRLAIIRGRLDLTKQIAHAHNAKVNDVVLAAVAGGLRELLATSW